MKISLESREKEKMDINLTVWEGNSASDQRIVTSVLFLFNYS